MRLLIVPLYKNMCKTSAELCGQDSFILRIFRNPPNIPTESLQQFSDSEKYIAALIFLLSLNASSEVLDYFFIFL